MGLTNARDSTLTRSQCISVDVVKFRVSGCITRLNFGGVSLKSQKWYTIF